MRKLLLAALCVLSSCATQDIHVEGSTLTSTATFALGKATPATTFSTTEGVRFITRFSWPNINTSAGIHKVDFKWYKEGALISQTHRELHFNETPYSVWTNRDAAALGPGHFRVETDVDETPVGIAEFTVHS